MHLLCDKSFLPSFVVVVVTYFGTRSNSFCLEGGFPVYSGLCLLKVLIVIKSEDRASTLR